ncbi:hypothetical protein H4R34_001057 [Dimargaris verticillata]|uniref:ABC transmembrane type-1 domain-containing protein n=1 Tax=Dimargaris verticillata TaxID=2761393 RepID=A0A9W8BAM4_9FUNG|nr:hypothetical protein H4R34_001057 [Dimargaris verticillata]
MKKPSSPTFDSTQSMSSEGAPRPPPLMENAGWLSQLSFHWVQPIISLGAKGGITDDNLNDLCPQDESHNLFRALKDQWEYETWQTCPDPETPSTMCLARAMAKTCMYPIIWTGLAGFIESVSKVGQAVFLGYLIRFFQDPDASLQTGLLFALGLSGMALVQGIMHHVYFFYAQRLGMQFRVALMGLMYHKSLGLPVSSSVSTGAVINVISNDVEPFERVALFAHFLWLAPLESLMALYFLWAEIGVSAVIGLSAFYLLVPLQLWFAKLFSAIRTRTVEARDERVRLLSDTLTGISLIKLSAWEEAMRAKISQLRKSEAKHLKHANILKALVEAIFFSMPPIAGVFTFISLHMIYHGFQSSQVFMTLALFNHLRLTFGQFVPKALESLAESRVSLNRINSFLMHPEVGSGRPRLIVSQPSTSTLSHDSLGLDQHELVSTATRPNEKMDIDITPTTPPMVRLCNASFSWTAASHALASAVSVSSGATKTNTLVTRPVLRDISLRIGAEELYAVVGPVGR